MSNPTKPHNLLADLPSNQKNRLQKVTESIQIDKITVSHSIEERNRDGRKTSAFYSVTASRGAGAEIVQLNSDNSPAGFSVEDAKIARLLLSKHVVGAVYDDAVKRGLLAPSAAQEELRSILTRYDAGIAKLLATVEEP